MQPLKPFAALKAADLSGGRSRPPETVSGRAIHVGAPLNGLQKARSTPVPPPCQPCATRKRWKSAILDFRPETAVPPAVIDRDRRVEIPKTQAGVGLRGYVNNNNNIGNTYFIYIFGTLGTAQHVFHSLAPMHSADFIPENRVRVRHPSRAVPPVPLCQPYSHKGFRHRPEKQAVPIVPA